MRFAARVILDSDLAGIYDVPVKALNQAVKRNTERFPEDFAFRLTQSEFESLRSQTVISGSRVAIATGSLRSQTVTLKRGQHRKYLPHVFTEHGAIMAANVLNSKQAVEMSVFVVRAFVSCVTRSRRTKNWLRLEAGYCPPGGAVAPL